MTADLGQAQHTHWQSVYQANPHMYGDQPSEPARYAAEVFAAEGATGVLKLGAGHGRTTSLSPTEASQCVPSTSAPRP